jgi:cysteinyl-tRNA synthetase
MGKSYNNFINLDEFFNGSHPLLTQAYSPMTIRFFILQAHYRSTVDFGNEALQAAEKGLERLMDALALLERITPSPTSTVDISTLRARCYEAMNDDLNTPIVIAHLFDAARTVNSIHAGSDTNSAADLQELTDVFHLFAVDLLGLTPSSATSNAAREEAFAAAVDMLLAERMKAKANKDWATSDQIRDQLAALGFEIKDTKEGTEWKLNK